MYKFESVNDQFEDFDRFVINSPLGNFRQTSYWGQIKSLSGWIPKHYILKKDGVIKATALIQIRKMPYTPFSLMYCCRGPIVDWTDQESCKVFFSGLSDVVIRNHGVCLRIDPEPSVYLGQQERTILENGFSKLKNRVTQWNRGLYTTRVFLNKSEDRLFYQMRRTHRQNINKALKCGITISTRSYAQDKNEFFQLMKGLENRRNSLIHSKKYYDKIFENIVEKDIGCFIKAIFKGKIISGLIIVVLRDKSWALFMANDYKYRKFMPNKLLLWEAIKIANSRGCKFLDLGSSQGTEKFDPENDPLDLLKQAYRPQIINFPGYYDMKGLFYKGFRVAEDHILPICLNRYYKIQRYMNINISKASKNK